nr:potassium transporter TrkG [Canibacter oris]
MSRGQAVRHAFRTVPARFAIVVFTLLIGVWTLLLSLPIAAADGKATPVIDAFFTAVSAICVTGLTVVDSATHWSVFGDVIILLGAQIGGIGVLSLAAILGLTVTRKLGLRQRLLAKSDGGALQHDYNADSHASRGTSLGDMRGLLFAIIASTLIIETALMALFFPQLLLSGYDVPHALWYSGYLAITTFTNTGFVPMADGLASFQGNGFMLGTMALGVFLGSIGFPVIFALWRYLRTAHKKSATRSIGLHAKLTLTTTLILIICGWIAIATLEANNSATFGSQNFWETALHSFYTSVMTRSGGFSVVDPHLMHGSTHLVLDMLMFVGGGSASTAGGIKVTTLAVLFLAAWAEARGYTDAQAFGRRIPSETLRVAVSVVIWGATVVAVSTITITHISGYPLDRVAFEVISGFATCGLSTGLSAELNGPAKAVLAITIWAGRVGTVTLASAIAATKRSHMFRFPEERPIVG